MSPRDLSRAEARAILTDSEKWSSWLAGRTPAEIVFDVKRNVWTLVSTTPRAKFNQDDLVVTVETEHWFAKDWKVADVHTAIRAAGAFARDPDANVLGLSDLDAIEAYEQNPDSRALVSILWVPAHARAFVASTYPRRPDGRPRDLPETVDFRPVDLFDKFGFDEGEALDAHVQTLRAEGWCLGADELLRAVVEARVLPLLDPRPTLENILSLHNNVRGLLEGHEKDLEEEDHYLVPSATTAWPTSITVSTAKILTLGREVAGPLTRRIRALEAALRV